MDSQKNNQAVWTRYANIWLGFWLLTSQIAFGYSGTSLGLSDQIGGIVLIFLAALSFRRMWASWALAMVGVWLQFAPLLFWAREPAAYLNDTLIGSLIIALSVLIPGATSRFAEKGPSIPPGWSYNPSSWPQRLPVIVLGTVGWFISRYLAAAQLGFIQGAWDPIFGTGTAQVIFSNFSRSLPISDAGLGAIAYTLEVLLALKGDETRWRTMPWMVLLFSLIVVPLGLVSIILIILQPLLVGAWCALCLCTAFCMMVMIAYAVDEIIAVGQFLHLKKREGKPFWPVFWKGDECAGARTDMRTPLLDPSISSLFSAASVGVRSSWNLVLSTLLGVFLMLAPWILDLPKAAADSDHVAGAFVIVISVISMGEVIRKARYGNLLLGLWVLGASFWLTPSPLVHAAVGILLIVLSFRRGQILESYGRWKC